ncbi:MAG: hypothetical protein ACYC2R_02285 [Burkholderiales bacterium]
MKKPRNDRFQECRNIGLHGEARFMPWKNPENTPFACRKSDKEATFFVRDTFLSWAVSAGQVEQGGY